MFKKISEAYAVLSNPERRNKYDKWGQTGKDDDFGFGDGDDFEAFMSMFGGDGFMDDMDDFINFLEKDELQFKKLFRGLGKGYRGPIGNKRGNLRSKAKNKYGVGGGAKGGRKDEEAMMEEMMAAMMMGEMMSMGLDDDDLEDGFGFGMGFKKKGGASKASKKKEPPKKSKQSKKDDDDDDGWETDSEEEVVENTQAKPTKID